MRALRQAESAPGASRAAVALRGQPPILSERLNDDGSRSARPDVPRINIPVALPSPPAHAGYWEMSIVPFAEAELPTESTTLAVREPEPPLTLAVGLPVIAPVVLFSVKPAGSLPDVKENVYGALPPVADSESLNAVPTVPLTLGNVSAKACTTVRDTVAACESPPPVPVTVT